MHAAWMSQCMLEQAEQEIWHVLLHTALPHDDVPVELVSVMRHPVSRSKIIKIRDF